LRKKGRKKKMSEKAHRAITISRQMGSGGTYLGYLLARKLDFTYIDREILRQAAQCLNADIEKLACIEGRSSGLLSRILQGFALGTPEAPNMPPLDRPVYDRELFTVEGRIMNELADLSDVVIIGRGAFHALRSRPGAIHVFAHAPLEFRIQRVVKVQKSTDVKQARAEIEESDQAKARFIKNMTGRNWTDSLNYSFCLDMSRVSFESSVEVIVSMLG
jgi:cytidylate kinase